MDMEVDEERRPLDALPNEMLMEALSRVEPADLLAVVPLVCKRWWSLAGEQQGNRSGSTPASPLTTPSSGCLRARWTTQRESLCRFDATVCTADIFRGVAAFDRFVRLLNSMPYLRWLDLDGAPMDLYIVGSLNTGLGRPMTSLVVEHGARLDRDLKLQRLACSIYTTGLSELLRRNAGSLRVLSLTDLYQLSFMDAVPGEEVDWAAMQLQVADVTEAVAQLVALKRVSLCGLGPLPQHNDLMCRQADSLLLAALARLPVLRELHLEHLYMSNEPPWPPREPVLQPGSMRLEVLELKDEFCFVSDEILAELLMASSLTLREFLLPCGYKLGPLSARALGKCRRLQRFRLTNLDRLRDLDGLVDLRHLNVMDGEEKTLTVDEVAGSAALGRLESLTLKGARPPTLLDAIVRRCDSLRELTLDQDPPFRFGMLRQKDKPRYAGPVDNPVVVLRLLEGAMPALRRLLLDPARLQRSHPSWAALLAKLRAHRPDIELL